MEQICLDKVRQEIDKKYVGFSPNGSSVKPVHIADGALRYIYGKCYNSDDIFHMALVCTAKGNVPAGNEAKTVYDKLVKGERIDDSISEDSIDILRNSLQRLVSVDNGVFTEGMVSYSAGSKFFITRKRATYEDAGEFVASLICKCCPELTEHMRILLDKAGDAITAFFAPILSDDFSLYVAKNNYEQLQQFNNDEKSNSNIKWFERSIGDAGKCLLDNLLIHSNPLIQMRLFNFFCIFTLIRYMSLLEAFYCNTKIRPIVLDFSGMKPSASSIARTSQMSYIQIDKSVHRFYSWAYAMWLKDKGYTKQDLIESETPFYKKTKEANMAAFDMLWSLAKSNIVDLHNDDMYTVFGETMCDMLALEASSHPIHYLRTLGTKSGIMYPPDRPDKRFVLSQDILEMLMKACVGPTETLNGAEIRNRLWNRFGIIVGGSQFDLDKLQGSGMILQIDEKSLEDNFSLFSVVLESMGYANVMADGVLQIRISEAKS